MKNLLFKFLKILKSIKIYFLLYNFDIKELKNSHIPYVFIKWIYNKNLYDEKNYVKIENLFIFIIIQNTL